MSSHSYNSVVFYKSFLDNVSYNYLSLFLWSSYYFIIFCLVYLELRIYLSSSYRRCAIWRSWDYFIIFSSLSNYYFKFLLSSFTYTIFYFYIIWGFSAKSVNFIYCADWGMDFTILVSLRGSGGLIKFILSISCIEGIGSGTLIVIPRSCTLPIYEPALDYPLFRKGGFIMPLDGTIGASSKFWKLLSSAAGSNPPVALALTPLLILLPSSLFF